MKVTTEVEYHVYYDAHGKSIIVKPSPDFPDNVLVMVPEHSQDYFGKVYLDIPKELAEALSKALSDAVINAKYTV